MSWFKSSGLDFSGLAKTALAQAQKSIDKVLDIQEENALDTEKERGKSRKPQHQPPNRSPRGNSLGKEKASSISSNIKDVTNTSNIQSSTDLESDSISGNQKAPSLKLDSNDEFFHSFLNESTSKNAKASNENIYGSKDKNTEKNVILDNATKPKLAKSQQKCKKSLQNSSVLLSHDLEKDEKLEANLVNADVQLKSLDLAPSPHEQGNSLAKTDNVQKDDNSEKELDPFVNVGNSNSNDGNSLPEPENDTEVVLNVQGIIKTSAMDMHTIPAFVEKRDDDGAKSKTAGSEMHEKSDADIEKDRNHTGFPRTETLECNIAQFETPVEVPEKIVTSNSPALNQTDDHTESAFNTSLPDDRLLLHERPLSTSTPQCPHDLEKQYPETDCMKSSKVAPTCSNMPDLCDTSNYRNEAPHAFNEIASTDIVNTIEFDVIDSQKLDVSEPLPTNAGDLENSSDSSIQEPSDKDNIVVLDVNSGTLEVGSSINVVDVNNKDDVTAATEVCHEQLVKDEEVDTLRKEVTRLQELVSAREAKMVILSKENIDMQETASILRSQLNQLEFTRKTEDSELDEMRQEFTRRIAETDQKLQTCLKERNALQQNLEETELRLTLRLQEQETVYSNALKEKEQQIIDLLEEGEKLSKKELKSNTMKKKLKSKVQELEQQLADHRQKLEESEKKEKQHIETIAKAKESEKELKDKIAMLETLTDSQEDEISHLKEKMDDADEKQREMQTNLDSAYIELHHVSLEKAQQLSEVQEATLQDAMKERENLQRQLDETIRKSKVEKDQLQLEVEDLQSTITRMNMSICRKEETFKVEIKEGLQRLQEAEIRNQELSQSISAATRPLLRQIESLQNTLTSQAQNWERVEKSHMETIASLQQQLAFANEKERTATSYTTDIKARVTVLEDSLIKLKQEREKLLSSEREKAERLESLEELLNQERDQAAGIQSSLKKSIQNLQNDKIFLEQQLTAERVRVEAEISRVSSEMFSEKARLNRQSSETHSSGEQQMIEPDVVAGHPPAHSRTSSTSSSQMISDTSFKGATTAVLERLQTQLRQRDGEIHVLQEETQSLERTRSALAQELLDMSSRIIELEEQCKELEILRASSKELQERYAVTLQMYGEKAEEADELRMDLEDVKQMYKQQMQDLFSGR